MIALSAGIREVSPLRDFLICNDDGVDVGSAGRVYSSAMDKHSFLEDRQRECSKLSMQSMTLLKGRMQS